MDEPKAIEAVEQVAGWTTRPTYAARFRCIGPECEDHCCGDWDIPLDKQTYRSYEQFPSKELASVVSQFVVINPPPQPLELYAQIRRAPSGLCPFFGADHLCGIQKEYGSQFLSSSCSIYPRSLSLVAERLEGSLSLSCPEAARNVLLDADFMHHAGDLLSGDFRTDNFYRLAAGDDPVRQKPGTVFLELRQSIVGMVQDRTHPLWHRLLMIGHLCKRLDTLNTADGDEAFRSGLQTFREPSEESDICLELDGMASDPRLRLEVIFDLTDALIRDGSGPRLQEVFWNFLQGIGAPPGSLPGDDVERFLYAEANYHSPFFESSPFVLENYLINYIFHNLFPYGRGGSSSFVSQNMFSEYLQMATQFAWVNALLVGVAGHYKREFSGEHVVETIQSFTRAVEHYPSVLKLMNEYMASRQLNSLEGTAIMLRG